VKPPWVHRLLWRFGGQSDYHVIVTVVVGTMCVYVCV